MKPNLYTLLYEGEINFMNEENVKNELKDFFGQQPIFFIKFVSKVEVSLVNEMQMLTVI